MKTGINDITPEQYHSRRFDRTKIPDLAAGGILSASDMVDATDLMSFVWKKRKEPTDDMSWGSLVDCKLTTPTQFHRLYHIMPEDAPKKPDKRQLAAVKPSADTLNAIAWWKQFEIETAGKTVITFDEDQRSDDAVGCLLNHPVVADIMQGAKFQVPLCAPLTEFGRPDLLGKSLEDIWKPGLGQVVDLKTTGDLERDSRTRISENLQYFVRMRWYEAIHRTATGENVQGAILIWQSRNEPYDIRIDDVSENDLELGGKLITARLAAMASVRSSAWKDLIDERIGLLKMRPFAVSRYETELKQLESVSG